MRYFPIRLFLCILCVCLLQLLSDPVFAGEKPLPFPSRQKPVKIARHRPAGQLPARYEPSGITWHPRLKKLIIVSDDGEVGTMNQDGSDFQTTKLDPNRKNDFESITIADPQSEMVYIGTERPNTIIEWNITTRQFIRRFNLEQILLPSGNDGIEALTFVPDKNHPQGGLFYVGYQKNGGIYRIELPIRSSKTATDSKLISHFIPLKGKTDLAGMTWNDKHQMLYGLWDKQNILARMTREGKILTQWKISGSSQEGIVIIDGDLYMAEDRGNVLRFKHFLTDK